MRLKNELPLSFLNQSILTEITELQKILKKLRDFDCLPRWHLLFQSQQWKQQNNVWNLFKVSHKNTYFHC